MLSTIDIPIPNDPSHLGGGYDASRDKEHLAATAKIRGMLVGLINTLSQFQPQLMSDDNGRAWDVLARTKGRIPPPTFPFQVMDVAEDPATVSVKVTPYSALLKEPNVEETLVINQLEATFTPAIDDWMWIEVEVAPETGLPTYAELKCGGTWSEYPEMFEADDDDNQIKAFVPIAYFKAVPEDAEFLPGTPLGNGSLQCVQLCRTHIMMAQVCAGDRAKAVLVGIPSCGGKLDTI